jgi:hypothetical protein
VLLPFRFSFIISISDKITQKLHWNFVIRLTIEAFLELTFSVFFNLKYASCNFQYLGSWVNYFLAILFACMLVAAPFFIVGFYWRNFEQLTDEEFELRYGSVYEGLKPDRRSTIIYTTYFVIRRAAYALTSVLLLQHVILQLELSLLITLLAACYIAHFQPFEEPLINRLEVMTEFFTMLLISVVFCFTDLFNDTKFQYTIGFVFIALMCLCIGCHLFFLFYELVHDLILSFKRWHVNR